MRGNTARGQVDAKSAPWDDSSPVMTLGGPGSEVFRARSTNTEGDRYVAVRLWCGASRSEVEAALDRVTQASRVSHPYLARVEACEGRGNAALWIISEYVPGPTLEAWLHAGRKLSIPAAIELVRNISLGVHAALREGISHHAIHPGNLVIWRQDHTTGLRVEAKLLDLSLASWMQPETPKLEPAHFMAPETLTAVLDGQDPSLRINARANVYSCGALLYYLTTGALPFRSGGLLELSAAQSDGKLWAPSGHNPEISDALQTVILGALAIKPSGRYANPGELASALAAVQWRDGIGYEDRPSSVPPPPPSATHARARKASGTAPVNEDTTEPTGITPTERSEYSRRSRLTAWSSILDAFHNGS
jgi:serine/threonine protein kinase